MFGLKARRRRAHLDVAHFVLVERVSKGLYEIRRLAGSNPKLIAKIEETQDYLGQAITGVDLATPGGCPDDKHYEQ